MAIDTSKLIAAPMLQDYLVDKTTGLPLAAGVITCYADNSNTLKNWYYQTGTSPPYSYAPLNNPLTLSAVGTITDPSGNDTIPFFYPVSESDNLTQQLYKIEVVNSGGQAQFTRYNFPFVAPATSGTTVNPTLRNYLVNNRFWRNIGSENLQNVTDAVVACSQHDTFRYPDIHFIKSTTGATETVTFEKFALGTNPLIGDITPEYYINHTCTVAQAGETQKIYQIPISLHVNTLESQTATVTIQGKSVSGNTIKLFLLQDYGTGATSPAPTLLKTIPLNSTWTKYTHTFNFPALDPSAVLSTGADDAYYLQIQMPLAATCNVDFALPSLYLSDTVPTNDFDTYDEIDAIINSPRTGDVRIALNTFSTCGWAPMSGGTLVNNVAGVAITPPVGSILAVHDISAWPLFSLIWNAFKAYDSAGTNLIAQMYDSTGATTSYGASAIADWTANKQLAVTQMMGRVLLGTVPVSALQANYSSAVGASNSGGNILFTAISVNFSFFNGMPVYFSSTGTLPDSITANKIYYVANFNGTTNFNVSTTFANAMAGTVVAYGATSGTPTITVTSALAGTMEGEYAHTLLSKELPDPITTTAQNQSAAIGADFAAIKSAGTYGTGTISNQGGNTPHNNTQPGTFMNMFIKL